MVEKCQLTNNTITIPEDIMERITWDKGTQLYMRWIDGELRIGETNMSEENVNANVQAYYDQLMMTNDVGC